MNKKSQFYIITAIILLALTFGFFGPKLTSEVDRTFTELCDNYLREASFAANTGNLEDFTGKFFAYGNTKEPDFGLVAMHVQKDNVTVISMLKKTIYINENQLSFNTTAIISRDNSLVITMGKGQYRFDTSEYPKISAFLYSESGETKKVCTR